jgi:hypothetical protein
VETERKSLRKRQNKQTNLFILIKWIRAAFMEIVDLLFFALISHHQDERENGRKNIENAFTALVLANSN